MYDKKITVLDTPYRLKEFLYNYKGLLTEYEAAQVMETMLLFSERIIYIDPNSSVQDLAKELLLELVTNVPNLRDNNSMNMLYFIMEQSCKDLIACMFLVDIIGHVKHVVRFNENVYVLETYKI